MVTLWTPFSQAKNDQVQLRIGGMKCAPCAGIVENIVKTLDGVRMASVNFATDKAVVQYDPKLVTARTIIAAIEEVRKGGKTIG